MSALLITPDDRRARLRALVEQELADALPLDNAALVDELREVAPALSRLDAERVLDRWSDLYSLALMTTLPLSDPADHAAAELRFGLALVELIPGGL